MLAFCYGALGGISGEGGWEDLCCEVAVFLGSRAKERGANWAADLSVEPGRLLDEQ